MKKLYFLYGLLILSTAAVSQRDAKTVDSLKGMLEVTRVDTARVSLMLDISYLIRYSKPDSSVVYAENALKLAERIHHVEGELRALNALGRAFSESDIPESMAVFLRLLNRGQEENSPIAIGNSYYGMGILSIYLENHRNGIYYFNQARSLAQIAKNKGLLRSAFQEMGGAYQFVNQPDSAMFFLEAAKKLYENQTPGGYWLYYMARLIGKQEPEKALILFRQSIQKMNESRDRRGLSLTYRWLSNYYFQHNKPQEALAAARNGLKAANEIGFLRGILYNSSLLVDGFKILHQQDSIYKYQSQVLAVRDSLFSQSKINQFQFSLIEERQKVQELEAEKKQAQLYGLSAALTFLLVFAGMLYRNNQKKQKANALLQRHRDEINSQRTQLQQSLETLQATQTQLIQKEKLASLGELTAGIAHEIQNPLNFVNNYSEVNVELIEELQEEVERGDKAEIKAILADLGDNERKIHHHGRRADAIVRGMLEHARATPGEKVPTDLNALADEYLRLAYHGLRAKDPEFQCELVTDFDPNLGRVVVAPSELGRVLLNLFNNAFYAVRQRAMLVADQTYVPTVWVSTHRLADMVEIEVRDNGTGMPEEIKTKIFQPFFTTKPTGEGTGLGLSLSYDIVTKGHGGALRVESRLGEGTEFVVELP